MLPSLLVPESFRQALGCHPKTSIICPFWRSERLMRRQVSGNNTAVTCEQGTSGHPLIQERIMATDYEMHSYGAKTENVNNPVTCRNADVSSSHSATLYVAELRCEENAVISVDHTATLTIGKLICKNGKLNVSYTSTLTIQYIECSETLDIQNSYSSTVYIAVPLLVPTDGNPSKIGKTTGLVNYSSTGQCGAWIN